jgi:hypothetical protein
MSQEEVVQSTAEKQDIIAVSELVHRVLPDDEINKKRLIGTALNSAGPGEPLYMFCPWLAEERRLL